MSSLHNNEAANTAVDEPKDPESMTGFQSLLIHTLQMSSLHNNEAANTAVDEPKNPESMPGFQSLLNSEDDEEMPGLQSVLNSDDDEEDDGNAGDDRDENYGGDGDRVAVLSYKRNEEEIREMVDEGDIQRGERQVFLNSSYGTNQLMWIL